LSKRGNKRGKGFGISKSGFRYSVWVVEIIFVEMRVVDFLLDDLK